MDITSEPRSFFNAGLADLFYINNRECGELLKVNSFGGFRLLMHEKWRKLSYERPECRVRQKWLAVLPTRLIDVGRRLEVFLTCQQPQPQQNTRHAR